MAMAVGEHVEEKESFSTGCFSQGTHVNIGEQHAEYPVAPGSIAGVMAAGHESSWLMAERI